MSGEKTSTDLEICEGQLLMMMPVVHFLRMRKTSASCLLWVKGVDY